MLRAASAGELGEGRRRKLDKTPKGDPSCWNVEVIEALCKRLPGGDVTVTARCETCKCLTWPCLCTTETAPRSAHASRSTLCPPRVLHEYQMRRLGKAEEENPETKKDIRSHHGKPLGNLRFVSSQRRGMDQDRLHVVSTADADAIAGTGERHCCRFIKANVVSRKAHEYVVQLDSISEWSQELELEAGDLKELVENHYYDDNLTIIKDVKLKSTKKTVVYHDRNEAEKDFALVQINKQWCVKEVWSPKHAEHERTNETTIVRNLGKPRPSGKAYEMGVRAGHRLDKLQESFVGSFVRRINGESDEEHDYDHHGTWHRIENMSQYLPGVFTMDANCEDEPADPTVNGLMTSASLRKAPPPTPKDKDASVSVGSIRFDASATSKDKHVLTYPCRLVFRALSCGWRITGVEADGKRQDLSNLEETLKKEETLKVASNPSDTTPSHTIPGQPADTAKRLLKQELERLADMPKKVTLFCTQTPYDVVSINDFKVRHEHVWERELESSREDDAQMLSDWCLNARLTPAQLFYAFREVRQNLQNELDLFQKDRLEMQQMLVTKTMKILNMQQELSATKMQGSSVEIEKKVKRIHKGLENTIVELRFFLQQIPLHYLVELNEASSLAHKTSLGAFDTQAECDKEKRKVQEAKKLMNELKASVAKLPAGTARGNQIKALREMRERQKQQREMQATQAPSGRPSLQKAKTEVCLGEKAGHVAQSKILQFFNLLMDHTDVAIRVGKKGKLQCDAYLEKGEGVLQLKDTHMTQKQSSITKRDGRMSKQDFEKVIVGCGITWLTAEEVEDNFKAMDKDGSGMLTIAEVLVFSQRLMELLLLVKDFQMELEHAGEKTDGRDDLIQQFVTKLMFGEDLVGGTRAPVIKDDKIKLQPEPSIHFAKEQTRLDYIGVPWMPKADAGGDPYIEWELPRQKLITAVVTRGDPRPGNCNWVTKFDLLFQETEGDNIEEGEFESCDNANRDGITRAWFPLATPVKAVRVRLVIKEWEGNPALRATLFGQTVKD